MDDSIAPVLPHPQMSLHDAFANPEADAYRRHIKSKLDLLIKHEEHTKSSEIRALKKEIECIDAVDLFFKNSVIFENYGDLEKYLTPAECQQYKSILSKLRDARITKEASFLERFYTIYDAEE